MWSHGSQSNTGARSGTREITGVPRRCERVLELFHTARHLGGFAPLTSDESVLKQHLIAIGACTVLFTGCSDTLGTTLIPNTSEPVEVSLFDFNNGSLIDPAAYDLLNDVAVRTDQIANWDFLFALAPDGTATLEPRSAVTGEESDAALQPSSEDFNGVTEAPTTGYSMDALTVQEGDVLFAVSRRNPVFQLRCRLFAKFEVLSIDSDALEIRLRFVRNPNCEQIDLQLAEA